MLNPDEHRKFLDHGNDAGEFLNILEEAAKLIKKRSSIPRKVHQYKELLIQSIKAAQKYNNDQSYENKKIFDDFSVKAAKKKIEVDELLNFFGMKNFLQDTIRQKLIKSKFKRPFEISEEINAEYSDKKSQCEIEVETLFQAKEGIYQGMHSSIGAINGILISLSPAMHKNLM